VKDKYNDTALHWAAHQGYDQIVALLLYFDPEGLSEIDDYGQSPLHLCSLKGHTACVRYMLQFAKTKFGDCKLVRISHKDTNGDTPLALSIDRKRFEVEWLLRRAITSNSVELVLGMGRKHLWRMKCIVLGWLSVGFSDLEKAMWAWRIVFVSNFVASMTSLMLGADSAMTDLTLLHYLNAAAQVAWWVCFVGCYVVNPGRVRDLVHDSQYAKGLEHIGQLLDEDDIQYSLCHTCHVRKPLRSKHCKVLNYCVHKFDHFCPFVGTVSY
jgi:hypothetical protein